MPTISRDQVSHLATLARIDLTEEETTRLSADLGAVLEAVAKVGEVASDDVPPMSHPVPLCNVLRADEVAESLTPEQALAAAPEAEDGRFLVPRILGEE